MPFVFLFIGFVIIAVAIRNTYSQLGALLSKDFTGQNNFFFWLAAIGIIGAIGYIKDARGISRAFLALILISMVLSDRGFFAEAVKTIDGIKPNPVAPVAGASGGGGAGGLLSGLGSGIMGKVFSGLSSNILGAFLL